MSAKFGAVAVLAGALASFTARPAAAQNTIQKYGARPSYGVELEPHLALGWIDPPGYGTGQGLGLGGRATFEIVGHGFIPSINNSVGIGVGLDYIHYYGDGTGPRGTCTQFVDAPAGTHVCTEVNGGHNGDDTDYLWIPVVLQWNFWLARRWSVFGELGAALRLQDMKDLEFSPLISWAGGRFHVTDNTTLTLRLGIPFVLTPYVTFGVSFLL
ncbi:MAG TPA: hypothetical protein VMI54_14915 [Polyangiaceae bacterium]|nr:hypothetical protein [Polyangiaceae bacterium]